MQSRFAKQLKIKMVVALLPSNDFAYSSENALACIFSLEGMSVSQREKSLFRDSDPLGFILFKRNIENPAQVKALTDELRDLVGRNCPVLIDQEGGRVARLRPPHWRDYKPMKYFGDLYKDSPERALEELRFEILRMSEELLSIGVNVDCAPVLDLIFEGAHDIIGDRSFSSDPDVVSRLGLSVCRNFLRAGITPIIKHIPGHGRAHADSHLELPVVNAFYQDLKKTDFESFRSLSSSDVGRKIWAMTAHVVFTDIDPDRPVSVSRDSISKVIRQDIGFQGVLIADDLDMKALDRFGTPSQKAIASLEAGCDLALYCAGQFEVMEELAENLPNISHETRLRLQDAVIEGTVAA